MIMWFITIFGIIAATVLSLKVYSYLHGYSLTEFVKVDHPYEEYNEYIIE